MALQSQTRVENPARWQKAAERAIAEGIQVRQLQSTGQWIATSGSDRGTAYEIAVTGAVAHGCDCLAGLNGDPCCKHRASWYVAIGALSVDPESDPPTPVATNCPECYGGGVLYDRQLEKLGLLYPTCPVCKGKGLVAA